MTEVERIITEGRVPHNFLQPETICDFFVDENRKKVWAVGIDLLVKFDEVCRKHNLQYSLAFGSLLGCVRHNGFIPWDDDVDVVMPRADYEKLRNFKEEFNEPYFLQYPGEDEGYCFSIARLRNNNTTSISWAFRYEKFNQGMFLDILPLDNFSSFNLEENLERIKILIAECSANMRRSCPFPDEYDKLKLKQFPEGRETQIVVNKLNEVLQINQSILSDKYIVWCTSIYDYKKKIFDKYLFDDLVDFDFYGHVVKIPKDAKKVLQITYGDYMQFPPVEQRGTWHSIAMFNPDVPYKETISELIRKDKGLIK